MDGEQVGTREGLEEVGRTDSIEGNSIQGFEVAEGRAVGKSGVITVGDRLGKRVGSLETVDDDVVGLSVDGRAEGEPEGIMEGVTVGLSDAKDGNKDELK